MGKINVSRIIVGGLAAGLVLNLFDFVLYGVVLRDDMAAAMAAIGKNMESQPIWLYVLLDFAWGMWIVWLYAMIRPRFGPGPRTAVYAGLFVWVGLGVLHGIGEAPMGIFATRLWVIMGAVYLVAGILAALAGAKLYQEA